MIESIIQNKRIKKSLLYTLIMGIIAYAVVFVNPYYIQDHWTIASPMTMHVFLQGGIAGARWFAGFLSILTAGAILPWLSGLLGLLFVGLSVYYVIEILNVKSEIGIILVAGIMTVNRTLVFSNLYGGLHTFTIALFFACFAAYYMVKNDSKKSLLLGVFGITMSLATYGVYVAVAIVLVAFDVFLRLLDGEETKKLIKKTGTYISVTAIGFIIYYIIFRILLKLTNITLSAYESRDNLNTVGGALNGALSVVPRSYKHSIKYYFMQGENYSVLPFWLDLIVISLALVLFVLIVIKQKKDKKIRLSQLLFIGVISLLMPLLLGIPNILSMGNMHSLMDYVYVMPYVFAVVVAEKSVEIAGGKTLIIGMKKAVMISIVFSLYYITVFANAGYTHLDDMYMTSISIGTRILDRIETVKGATGDESVIIIGELDNRKYLNTYRYGDNVLDILNDDYTGALMLSKDVNTVFTEQGFIYEFLRNALGSNREIIGVYSMDVLKGLSKTNSQEKIDIYNQLDSFPSEKCLIKKGNIIYLKLGDLPY